MEYFSFTDMWEKFFETDDDKYKIEKGDRHKSSYQNWCSRMDGKIPKEIAETLLKEFDDEYYLYVHSGRVEKEEVFENGLKIRSGNNLEKTATLYTNNLFKNKTDFFVEIMETPYYKNSKRAVILKIPKTAIEYVAGESKPILMKTNEPAEDTMMIDEFEKQTILMPEYVLGSVEYNGNQVASFERNPNYKEVHDYSNEGLICESGLIGTFESHIAAEEIKAGKREDGDFSNPVSKEEANRMIIEQNNEFMKKKAETRSEADIKRYSKKDMLFSKFNQMVKKIKDFFTKDKKKEGADVDVDR